MRRSKPYNPFAPFFPREYIAQHGEISEYMREILAQEDYERRVNDPRLNGERAFGPHIIYPRVVCRAHRVKRKRGKRSCLKIQRRKFWKQIYRNIRDYNRGLRPPV